MKDNPIIVLITVPSKQVGRTIADSLIERKLAACVNIVSPIQSVFMWKGEVNDEEEALLIAKSRSSLFENELIPAVQAVHPYEVPEIIALPIIMGLQSYLDWIEE
jgi:periplasmic divalent cation tolerance protein